MKLIKVIATFIDEDRRSPYASGLVFRTEDGRLIKHYQDGAVVALEEADDEEVEPNHTAEPAKKVEPAKPLSVDEIFSRFQRNVINFMVRVHGLSGGQIDDDFTLEQAKAHLIELVDKISHDISLVDNGGMDAISKAHNKGIENMRQALIKAIEGGEG